MSIHASARRRPVVALALLAAMLLLPIATVVGGVGSPAAAEAPLAQLTPDAAATGQAQAQPVNESGLFLNIWDCAESYGGDLGQLIANCTVVNNVTFDVLGPNYQESFQGGFSLQAMPAGNYTIREYVPQGYGAPLAFCGFAASDDQQPPQTPVVVYDGYYEFQLGQNQSIYCNWFNVPLQPAPTATIRVIKHLCPPVSEFDAYEAGLFDLAPNCQETSSPVSFSVAQNGASVASGTAATGAPLTVPDLPTGTSVVYQVIEEVPDGYDAPVVFCKIEDELLNDRVPTAQAQVDNDRITLQQLNDGDVVTCDWFNVPAPLGTTISVLKYDCPVAIGYDEDGYDAYADDCDEPAAGVSFKLDGASTGNPGEQLTDSGGQVTWSEMEADHYFLTEEVPSGFDTPVVFCSYYDPAALQDRDYDSYPVSADNRIEFDVADGQSIACTWFNISANRPSPSPDASPDGTPDATPGATAQETATLTIRTYRCDAGYAFLDEDADPEDDCTERPDDIEFELAVIDAPDDDTPRRADTGGGDEGDATFDDLDPDDYLLTELDFPEGDTAYILACDSNERDFADYPFSPFALVAADGTVRLSLVAAETLVCDWYDVPAEGPGLNVQVYACAGDVQSVEACDPATGQFRFVLAPVTGDGDPITFQTDETGAAHLDGLDGTYTLSEVGQQPCAVESTDADANGNLTLDPDRETVVHVFNCA